MRVKRVQPAEGTHVDYDKWKRVKLYVLGGAFNSSPGSLVSYTRFGVYKQHFKRAGSMKVQYTFNTFLDKSRMILVHKDEWTWDELVDIATESVFFSSNMLWMLPNTDKIMSLNEAEKVDEFLCKLDSLNFDSEFLDEGEWETVGCKNSDEMTWTNPSPQRVDLVVDSLKKLCSEHKIEFEEM